MIIFYTVYHIIINIDRHVNFLYSPLGLLFYNGCDCALLFAEKLIIHHIVRYR